MKKTLTIRARLGGLPVSDLTLRRKIENGGLTNQWELVFAMPGLGSMPMQDDFAVEIYDLAAPKAERKWVETTVGEVKRALLDGKHTKNKNTAPIP